MVSATFRVALMGCLLLFGVLYVIQMNEVSTKGFDMSDLQRNITQLGYENERLEFEIAQHRSLGSIQKRLEDMDFVRVTDARYVSAVGSAVARR